MNQKSLFEHNPFRIPLILVVAFSESAYRIIENHLQKYFEGQAEIRWHSDTIEALADIFMSKPDLLIIFGDNNQEGLDFLQLVRNNHNFKSLPVFMVFPEPLRYKDKKNRLNIAEVFSTPINGSQIHQRTRELLFSDKTGSLAH